MTTSSRQRYEAYQDRRRQRADGDETPIDPIVPEAKRRSKERSRSFFTLFRHFLTLMRGHNRMLVLSLIASGLGTMIAMVPLYGTKLVIDNVLGGRPVDESLPASVAAWFPTDAYALLLAVGVTMVAMAIVATLIRTWGRWHATRISKRMQMSVRKLVFDHAVRLPLHRIYAIKSGGASSMLRQDAGAVGDLVFPMLYNPWRAIVQLLFSLVMLIFIDWRLLLGSLIILPTVYFSHRTWIARIRPMYRDIRATRTHVDSHAAEAFGGIRIVRGFARQRTETERFVVNNHLMARQELYTWWWARGIEIAWGLIIPIATAALLFFGGKRILDDQALVDAGTLAAQNAFTVGDLVLFLAYLTALLDPIATLAMSATSFQNGLAGLDRILDVMEEPVDMPPAPDAVVLERDSVQGRITLEGVCFTYPETETPVLSDINLDVEPGELVAFVGPSGAGKTTLSNIIARFYKPTQGTIRIDGIDLENVHTDSYRRLLGIVEQDIFLFDGTLAENIGYARRDATRDEIIEAARQANADVFIRKFEKGYDSLVGERGVKLSGGQRQRVAIARALLAQPRILILDEATSNLDTESERLIQASLGTLMAGRTSFVIAHRLSTIQHADKIVVIDEGRIIEQGRHDDLMTSSGRYREMVDLQTRPPEPLRAEEAEEAVEAH